MGPSGSGKTTLLLMLGAMLRPTSGSVVDGIDLATAPERELPTLRSRHLGFVFQDFNVLSALSAWENVELACNLGGTTGSKARDRAAHLRCTPAGTHRPAGRGNPVR
ncbi:MAG TPA: ATP-binding cassette domain-containing protein [Acidimicrobiales bacterium]